MAKLLCLVLAASLALSLVEGSLFIPTHSIRSAEKRSLFIPTHSIRSASKRSLFIPTHNIRSALKRAAGDDDEEFECSTQITERQVKVVGFNQALVAEKMAEVSKIMDEVKQLRQDCGL